MLSKINQDACKDVEKLESVIKEQRTKIDLLNNELHEAKFKVKRLSEEKIALQKRHEKTMSSLQSEREANLAAARRETHEAQREQNNLKHKLVEASAAEQSLRKEHKDKLQDILSKIQGKQSQFDECLAVKEQEILELRHQLRIKDKMAEEIDGWKADKDRELA